MRPAIAMAIILSLGICGRPALLRAEGWGCGAQSLRAELGRSSNSVWDGVYTVGQARRGAALTEGCASCHGFDLEGDVAPTLIGPEFTAKWSGKTLADLFERIEVNFEAENKDRPEGERESLSRRQSADFLAYILMGNRFPTGEAELPVGLEFLHRIRFLASRP